ncbi:MAG: carbonic anhydrase family protein [Acidimicrobiia bacterium]
MQSPIDLTTNLTTPAADGARRLSVSYHHLSHLTTEDAGWTVTAVAEPGGVIGIDGTQYSLSEIHCHTPSEHTIDGVGADLEAHFVHQAVSEEIAVVGVMFDPAPGSHPIDMVLTSGPQIEPIRLSDLVPFRAPQFSYVGSLTTPPFTDNVRWVVLTERLPVGVEALTEFADRYGPNNRPVQPTGSESISYG